MTSTITFDLETRSHADLLKVGAWAYSEDPTTDVICACYGIDDEPVQRWWPRGAGGAWWRYEPDIDYVGQMPADLHTAVSGGALVEAHNVSFEWSIWENILTPRHGWVMPFRSQWRDTMAVACYYAMPAGLDKLARALNFEPKDPEGGRLITKYSKLNLKTAKEVIPDDDFEKFVKYCVQDVRIEQAVSDYLGDLPDRELPIFQLDLEKGRRGLFLDTEGIDTATKIVEQREAEYANQFRALTGLKPTQIAKVKVWLKERGLELESMTKDILQDLLDEGELPSGDVRKAIELRMGVNSASTKKLNAMTRNAGKDGRARFQTRYHGAAPGRSTGTGFQPLNLKRGFEDMDPEQLVRDIGYGDAKWLDSLYGDAMTAVGNAARYWIKAQPGNCIIAGDFVSIEAVLLACLAEEEWKVQAFTDGVKIYEHMADKIHKLAPGTVTKKTHPAERQDGKTGELAFGYQGALGAWLKFDSSGRHTDERIIEICKAWRAEHPQIVNFWYRLQDAATDAVLRPGLETSANAIGYEIVDDWLSCALPNGKRIWYFKPEVRQRMPHWHQPWKLLDDEGHPNPCHIGTCDCRPGPTLTYMAWKNGQWKRVGTYGGKLAENVTQATSREVLKAAELRVKAARYHVILDVYDEIVCEEKEWMGDAFIDKFKEIMMECPGDWAKGWPIGVDVWSGDRYRK